jgi:peroxiredoxin (alkyl hydroperoxide reductase subunit C)
MPISVGDRIPDASLTAVTAAGPIQTTSREIFDGKKVVFFTVPGAFTPTCNNQHLPGYLAQYDALKAKGVASIVCLAVNDVHVMTAWAKANDVGDRILMIADGNGDFARAIGFDVDLTKFNMGTRARRASAIVEDGVIKELNLEAPGKLEVSTAEATLCQL